MRRSEQRRQKLEQLLDELRAINFWDRAFYAAEKPDLIEFIAWENRRRRVSQLYQALFARFIQRRDSVGRSGPQLIADDDDE